MSWAAKRQLAYFFGVLLVVGSIVFGIVHKATSVPPTCFDRKQNGGEKGVDCGGPCNFYCPAELADPKVRWVRTFQSTPGLVHAVAYIEHSYPTAGAQAMNYSFKLYDDKNTLITERTGTTFLGPMGRTAITETLIPVGNSVPVTTRFTVIPPLTWEKIPVTFSQVVIKTDNTLLENLSSGTRLTATITNQSRFNFKNVDVVALIYDENDNVITASKSVITSLEGLQQSTVYFTWSFKITQKIGRIEIVPRPNPFTSTTL